MAKFLSHRRRIRPSEGTVSRLMRYGARPPFSLDRLLRPGGCIAYRIKKLGAGRAKHRVMTPLELLARLAAIVRPPRYSLDRYHGVLAPHSAA